MTINVCVRVPDGCALASDSLATSLVPVQPKLQIGPLECDQCGHQTAPTMIQAPAIGVPGSSTPLASKLFYVGNYGLVFFGSSSINSRSLFNHVLVYRTQSYREGMSLSAIADGLGRQLADAAGQDPALQKAKAGTPVGGFQICGYDKGDVDIGRSATVSIVVGEADAKREDHAADYGVTVTGDSRVVNKLFSAGPGSQAPSPNFVKMTLPDAIDYARFLVQATSDYHRFADMVPTVGGPTEVAVITKWIGFRFVDRKKLFGQETARLNVGKISQEIRQIRQDLPGLVRDQLAAVRGQIEEAEDAG